MFLKILIFKILYFLKMCTRFVGSVQVDMTVTLFNEKNAISTRCMHDFMPNFIKKICDGIYSTFESNVWLKSYSIRSLCWNTAKLATVSFV